MYKLNLVGSLLPANGPDELLRNNNFLITSGTSASFQFDLSSLAFGMVASQWGSPQPNLGPYKIVTNLLTHFEISGEQPSALADFYRNVFGWQIEQMPGVDYWRVRTGSSETKTLTGGLTYRAIPGLNGWMLFVNVASLDETVALVQSLGGSIIRPKTAVPKTAWVTIVADPAKNILGVWQEDPAAFPPPEPD